MNKQDFYFDLPPELIAQYPLDNRSDSRLLTYSRERAEYGHYCFKELADLLKPGDLLVMNDSKVIPARLYGQKSSGGKVEFLVERITSDKCFLAHIKASKALKPGALVSIDSHFEVKITGRQDDLFICESKTAVLEMLYQAGHIPLPPYISRSDESMDALRYQTIYAQYAGSVAAPTAGLHFDEGVMQSLASRGVQVGYVTLHVGSGTFRPVRCENILEHKMHSEQYTVGDDLCAQIRETRSQGGRVIAVGTTALRSLESAASQDGSLQPKQGDTDIFIYPGYQFKICDGLITNFHLPESTLLMLVSAFIGHKEAMALYAEAIRLKYRFFSYGDASFLI